MAGPPALPVAIFAGARDAQLTKELLQSAGLDSTILSDAEALWRTMEDPMVGAVILDEDLLDPMRRRSLSAVLASQPPWSELPLIFVRSPDRFRDDWWQGLERASVTILDRPLKRNVMEAAVRVAVRARVRQHQVRDLLDRLEEENRTKDQFIAMLGHELRNPLSVILSAAQMLGLSSDRVPHYRDLIQRQVGNLSRIVDDILDVSRMMHGKLSIQREPIDLGDLVRRCAQECGPAATRRRQKLDCDCPAEPVYVSGDPVRLEQVLSNLVGNAIKYTPERGHIVLSLRRGAADAVEVIVRDDGIGIAPAVMPHLFDLFSQGPQPLARTSGGFGIGLALVKNIIELHGGTVKAVSAGEGQGSEFTVTLPLLALQPVAAVRADVPKTADRRLRIVLVEDNDEARELLTDFLTDEGHDVQSVGDGRQGAELIVGVTPDVAVVDIGLPTIDGYEVARYVRSHLHASVRLVALTGYGQPQDRAKAAEAGFDIHLVKPIHPPDLLRFLGSISGDSEPDDPPRPQASTTVLEPVVVAVKQGAE